ncbi:MAG TPA: DUF1128 domain-containing protein [Bacillales bacterium]|nr:DUF1128 domain-containing protein [Bacillales bacterium]
MNLNEKNRENVDYMITEIKNKLQFVNPDVVRTDSFGTDKYDDLKDIYDWVMAKPAMSVSEMQAILSELKNLRD